VAKANTRPMDKIRLKECFDDVVQVYWVAVLIVKKLMWK